MHNPHLAPALWMLAARERGSLAGTGAGPGKQNAINNTLQRDIVHLIILCIIFEQLL